MYTYIFIQYKNATYIVTKNKTYCKYKQIEKVLLMIYTYFHDYLFRNGDLMNTIIITIKQIASKLSKDSITSYAAQSCFYILLSFFPALIILMSLIHYLPVTPDTIIEVLRAVAPPQIEPVFETIINDVYNNSSIAIVSITAVVVLWSAGKGFLSIMQCLNSIYGSHRHRNWFISRIISTVYTLIFLLSILLTLVLMVFGDKFVSIIGLFLPKVANTFTAILHNRTLLFPCVLMVIFLCMYKYVPNRKTTFFNELPGAVFAATGWFLFSYFYSVYVNHSPNFSLMYGSLSTLVFALMWMYFCMIIVFLGAELNMFLTKKRSGDFGSWIEEL